MKYPKLVVRNKLTYIRPPGTHEVEIEAYADDAADHNGEWRVMLTDLDVKDPAAEECIIVLTYENVMALAEYAKEQHERYELGETESRRRILEEFEHDLEEMRRTK